MHRITLSLLLTLLVASTVTSTKEYSLKTTQWNELMEKIDNISTQGKSLMPASKTDTGIVSQVIVLTSKMATVEMQLQNTRNELQKTRANQQKAEVGLQKTEADLQATKAEVKLLRSRESNPGSSSFVRWGRKSCPGNTTLVYSGVAAGKHYNQKGNGVNRLCLSRQPEFDSSITTSHWGQLFGAEYQNMEGHHDHDVPCSVCLAPQSSTIMVPGTRTCPPTWTRQYQGHLTSHYHSHFASEYVCLDQELENESSGVLNQDGNLFYYTKAVCGSLPCPPYINNMIVTCVVCSK